MTNRKGSNNWILQLISIQRNGRAESTRPRILFCGDWLTQMGFINGALVQALPEPKGFVFHLCNENVHYSELFTQTKEKGGTLIRVHSSNKRTGAKTTLVTTGYHIYRYGLCMGDSLVAKCEYGCIRLRKISDSMRLIHVAKDKKERTGEYEPKIWICGEWMHDIGFTPDTLVTVAMESNLITLTAQNEAIVYRDVVHFVRKHHMRLAQVATRDGVPLINVKGSCATRAGFALGDMFAVTYEYGRIKLQKPDLQALGF